jgi:hypothetical protein
VIDLKDKTAPQLVTNQPTPGLFNHNTWLSNDSKTLYTTDEKPNTPLASFDITDLDNITLLDTYYPSQLPSKEVHNVRVHNDFLINPSYGGQLTIVDAHRPQNLVETAWAILGTSLVWDADPYLPSGIVFATAKNEGLFIYQPTYTRAAYLEGRVRDSLTNDPIKGASIRIVNTIVQDSTNVQGYYTTGYHSPGFWTIEVSCPGYQSKSIPLVEIKTAQVTTLDIVLAQASTAYSDIKNQQKFRIYPSAFIDGITVEAMGIANENAYLELTDLFGKLLYSAKIKDGKQRVEWGIQWAPGHYLLTLKGKSGLLHTERLIKS